MKERHCGQSETGRQTETVVVRDDRNVHCHVSSILTFDFFRPLSASL